MSDMKHRWFVAALLCVSIAFSAAPALAAAEPAQIIVTGQGTVSQTPDMATLNFSIVTNDDVAERAATHNNTVYNAVLSRLGELGIAKTDIRTTYYGMNFVPRPEQTPQTPGIAMPVQRNERYGYIVNRGLTVTIHDTKNAGRAIDVAVAAGVTDIGGVAFGIADQRSAFGSALKRAVQDAESQAKALASAANLRIVRVRTIQQGYAVPQPPVPMMRTMAAAAEAVPTQIEPGSVSVQATVTITFDAAPGP
ncbi:MAG: SIMPL domain-containing protein [Candidatus Eremiobacteraeota bacterium]|nr:SIMPL domain-containing protein [Candidatus Eremiobacteraeota bacterium]